MKRHILILIAILLTSVVLAQQVPISEEKVIIDGQKFYLHTVEKGHTLYSIGKAYSVDTEIIEEYNHGAIEGLKLGQILKIPIIETSLNEGVDLSRDEVNFIYHTVKRKETVYSLTKQYGITEDEFYEHNPGVIEDGLKTGNEIIIPRKQAFNEYKYDFTQEHRDTSKYYYHNIKKGETLFSLSREFDISRYELKKANPDVDWNKLKLGQEIAIPIEYLNLIQWPDYFNDSINSISSDSILNDTDSLNVLMLLPFNVFANNKQLYNQDLQNKELSIYPLSEVMLDFYAGVLIALDSIQKSNSKISVRVEDVGNDTVIISRLINEESIKDYDVIIGPVFSDQIYLVKQHINDTSIIINPFTECSLIDLVQGKLCVSPPEQEMYSFICEYLSQSDSNQYIVLSDRIDERVHLIYNELIKSYNDADKDSPVIKKIAFVEGEVKTLQNAMSKTMNNVVIIPAHSEPYIARIMSKLSQVEDVKVQLIGDENWLNYSSIEPRYFTKLNFTYSSIFNINYSLLPVQRFVNTYREVFNTEPTKYGFLAYDITLSLFELYNLNLSIINGINPEFIKVNGLASNYTYRPFVPGGAIVNTNLYLYTLSNNYSLKMVYSNFNINNYSE